MKPTILTTQHTKPTHLHSHLLLPPDTGRRSKSKRECKPTHPFTADRPLNQNKATAVFIVVTEVLLVHQFSRTKNVADRQKTKKPSH